MSQLCYSEEERCMNESSNIHGDESLCSYNNISLDGPEVYYDGVNLSKDYDIGGESDVLAPYSFFNCECATNPSSYPWCDGGEYFGQTYSSLNECTQALDYYGVTQPLCGIISCQPVQ